MTEAEWFVCTDPTPMMEFQRGKASDRKLRLFACACCRDIWELIVGELSRNAVEASEAFADGRIRRKDLIEIRERARRKGSDLAQWAVMAASRPKIAVHWVAHLAADAKFRPGIHRAYVPKLKPSQQQCDHLREIIGPVPFRTIAIDRTWLDWNDETVHKLAHTIYEDRRFSDVGILADALEDAGCDNADILGHLRGPGLHYLGCWVIDALTGRS